MGKVSRNTTNPMPHTVSTSRVKKKSPCKVTKRILMLKRRLNSIIEAHNGLVEKNKDLLSSLTEEKKLSATLRQESFHWQRQYYEAMMTINTYKVKQDEVAQVMATCLREVDSAFPHLVSISEAVTNNKIRLSNTLASLPSSEYGCLPRRIQDFGKKKEESVLNNEKPAKHKVGPMVRGLLITKPKIMLERLMLPLPQDQEPVNDAISTMEVNNQLSPVAEENEQEASLRHISMRPKRNKSKLGTSWRQRRQEQIDKDQERERERERERVNNAASSTAAYDGDSSDSESNINHIEPVLRYKDVSRMLQNSSLLKVDAKRSTNGEGTGSNLTREPGIENLQLPLNTRRAAEDPLEGSSWMFNNSANHRKSYRSPVKRPSTLSKSFSSDDDDDDDDDEVVVKSNNKPSLSMMNTLIDKDQHDKTFAVPNTNSSHLRSGGTNNGSFLITPGPTRSEDANYTDDQLINSFLFKRSSSSSNSSGSPNKPLAQLSMSCTLDNSTNQSQSNNKLSISTNSLTVSLSKVSNISRSSTKINNGLTPNKRKSSYCDNCSPAMNHAEVLQKRSRKPKNHLYPGEEDIVLSPNRKSSYKPIRKSITRKSLPKNKKSKGKEKKKKSLSKGVQSKSEAPTNTGNPKNRASNKKETVIGADKGKNSKARKGSVKTSLYTPRNSESETSQTVQENGRPSRRARQIVCYKESPVNVKMRRP